MKYTLSLNIDLPRDKVVELFDNTENLKKWQKGLISFETQSGKSGQEGTRSLLKYKMGKREVEMTETITKRNLPDEFFGTYEANNVWNEVKNYFKEVSENKTLWEFETEFKFKGFMKLMSAIMPGAFKKQSYNSMLDFKAFAEEGKTQD
jgi:hypothetical protein